MLLFDFNDSTIERFTEGDCWVLALELAKTLVPVGWKVGWAKHHAFVVSPCYRFYLDIYGVQLLDDFPCYEWGDILRITDSMEEARDELENWGREGYLWEYDALSPKDTVRILLSNDYFKRYSILAA